MAYMFMLQARTGRWRCLIIITIGRLIRNGTTNMCNAGILKVRCCNCITWFGGGAMAFTSYLMCRIIDMAVLEFNLTTAGIFFTSRDAKHNYSNGDKYLFHTSNLNQNNL